MLELVDLPEAYLHACAVVVDYPSAGVKVCRFREHDGAQAHEAQSNSDAGRGSNEVAKAECACQGHVGISSSMGTITVYR